MSNVNASTKDVAVAKGNDPASSSDSGNEEESAVIGAITLEACDGTQFFANESILSYLSPVFAHMFGDCHSDGKPLRLSEDADTLDLLMDLVSNNVQLDKPGTALVAKVLKAADKYDMRLIRSHIECHVL